jgi:hypothetical protein
MTKVVERRLLWNFANRQGSAVEKLTAIAKR